MSGHGFQVTGDPADLPPGAKMIELNISASVEAVARALHAELEGHAPHGLTWEQEKPMVKHNLMELGMAAVMALVEQGWHSMDMHTAIKTAMDEEENAPKTGMDPR